MERSQALHCSRVTARPAASVGARSPAMLASHGRAAPACSRRPGTQSETWRLGDRDTNYLGHVCQL